MSAVAAATHTPDDRVTADDRLDRWLETLHEADDDEAHCERDALPTAPQARE